MHHEQRTQADLSLTHASWGAVIAGIVIVLMTQLTLALLGLAVGLAAVDVTDQASMLNEALTGNVIWWFISGLIALFFGGWVSGRLSGMPRCKDGFLHGLVTWGASNIILLFLLSSAVGTIMGGAYNVLVNGLKMAGQATAQVAGAVASQGDADPNWQRIQNEARSILRESGRPELQPENLQQNVQEAGDVVQQSAQQVLQDPSRTQAEWQEVMNTFREQLRDTNQAVDEEAVANVLVARTNMTQAQAQQTVQEWSRMYQQAATRVEEGFEQARENVEEAAPEAAGAVGEAAFWAFLMMILGAAAAGLGGMIATPRLPHGESVRVKGDRVHVGG